jgi:hypothetical protein
MFVCSLREPPGKCLPASCMLFTTLCIKCTVLAGEKPLPDIDFEHDTAYDADADKKLSINVSCV